MRPRLTAILVLIVATFSRADDISAHALWITGDVFSKDGVLFFRADKPVQGNATGDVVLLGSTKDLINVLGPLYMRAAERHLRLRLYGALTPAGRPPPGHSEKLPTVEFITWKVHSPGDPDDMPADKTIHLDPKTKIPGYTVGKPQ